MVETNLPIIFLGNVVVFPYSEIRVEFNLSKDKLVLENASKYNDNYVLLINLVDPLEENPRIKDLPNTGVIGKIKSKIELANGMVRVVITGIDRVEVINYFESDYGYLESFVVPVKDFDYDEVEARALRRLLFKNLTNYIDNSSFMSNSVLGRVSDVDSISKLTDIVVFELPLDYSEKLKYLNELNPIKRIKMITADLCKEIETVKLENELETSLKEKIDDSQREYLLREKIRIIKEELGESDIKDSEVEDLKSRINKKELPIRVRKRLLEELKRYSLSSEASPEITIIRSYIDWMLNLPWLESSKDNYKISEVMEILNESHYGLVEVKRRICEYVCVMQKTDKVNSPIICLTGPPGVGKTTLAKSIAKSLNKMFVKISVGGVNDEAEIMGHRRTYLGASPGKIIQGLKKAGTNNPIFLIDEVDKMTRDYHGDPAAALLEVLDREQNSSFCDNYIEEEFDLSKVVFILTANDITKVPVALRDRLEVIELSSYTNYEKQEICKKYLIPKLFREYKLRDNNIVITDDGMRSIIRDYTRESGARELSRLIEKICRRILCEDINDTIIDKENLVDYLGIEKYHHNKNDNNNKSGIVNGLAYTVCGGEVLKVSVTKYKGKGNFKVTGSVGGVMCESVDIAVSYLKSNCDKFGIDYKVFNNNDFHIHIEDGSTPKDGPSAGITVVSALISLIKDKIISNSISMTGEITLRGKVLPVGGLREKLIAASVNDINKVFIPVENKYELESISDEIKEKIEIVFIRDYLELYYYLFNE